MIKGLFGNKVDGVVEAVRFSAKGNIQWVRAYERRGPTWSDHVILERGELIERLKSGQKFFTGQRLIYRASDFDLGEPIRVLKKDQGEVIVSGGLESDKDRLEGVPVL